MFTKRIIPCLDVKEGKVVKGINFVGLKEVGDPVELARQYYEQGADEIVFLDISATNEGRKTMADVAQRVAKEIFIPFTIEESFFLRIAMTGGSAVSITSSVCTISSLSFGKVYFESSASITGFLPVR